MSTFAVFGMTADVALAEARKTTPTTKQNPAPAGLPVDRTLAEWEAAVAEEVARIMASKKSRQLSQLFDAPQYAEQFVALVRKQCECRDLRIRAKCVLKDEHGGYIINKKTKAPKVGWKDYSRG